MQGHFGSKILWLPMFFTIFHPLVVHPSLLSIFEHMPVVVFEGRSVMRRKPGLCDILTFKIELFDSVNRCVVCFHCFDVLDNITNLKVLNDSLWGSSVFSKN